MIKLFRAFDGEAYWYSDDKMMFIKGHEARTLHEATQFEYFTMENIEQYVGKVDSNGVKIYENSIICNPLIDPDKLFRVIWSNKACGFRKVPVNQDLPVTKIDEAFMEVIGTVHLGV